MSTSIASQVSPSTPVKLAEERFAGAVSGKDSPGCAR